MKNTTMILGIIVLLAIGGYFVFGSSQEGNIEVNGNVVNNLEEVQKFVLSEKDYNYYPREVRVKANQPVSISLDKSVTGCLRSFTIKDLKVAKYLRTPSDSLEFTPTQQGTYTFACSMGMGYGKLIVE